MGTSENHFEKSTTRGVDSPWMFGPSTEGQTRLSDSQGDLNDARTTTEPGVDNKSRTTREQGPTAATTANQASTIPAPVSRGSPKEGTLQGKSNRPKFHFCPADVLILGLGMAIFGLQTSAAQRFSQPTKSIMLMTCMGIVVMSALTHNLITCRIIRLRVPFVRISIRVICLSISVFAALAATIVGSVYPYSELKTGGVLILPNCQVLFTPSTTQLPLMPYDDLELCNEIQASHILSYLLLSMEAIAAFLTITHWINVKEIRDEGLPLTLGELLRMTDRDVNRALKTLQIQAEAVDMETKRRMVAHKLDLIADSPV